MNGSLFSTYRTGENRVTASIMAVLRSLALGRIERLLGALMGQPEFQLVRFQNQPSKGASGVPDAEIISSCRILVETKVARHTVDRDQLRRHLKRLDQTNEHAQCLIVLAPDDAATEMIEAIQDRRLVYASFAALHQAIDEMLDDKSEVISEREAFLLRELQQMLLEEGLIGSCKDTVVVAARHAWADYQALGAYICQPGRPFQGVNHIAFYASGEVKPLVPRIEEVHDNVVFEPGRCSGRVGEIVTKALELKLRDEGTIGKVFVLSSPDETDKTVRLPGSIKNDLRSASGTMTAFTQGQRYVSLEDLLSAQSTSDLVRR